MASVEYRLERHINLNTREPTIHLVDGNVNGILEDSRKDNESMVSLIDRRDAMSQEKDDDNDISDGENVSIRETEICATKTSKIDSKKQFTQELVKQFSHISAREPSL